MLSLLVVVVSILSLSLIHETEQPSFNHEVAHALQAEVSEKSIVTDPTPIKATTDPVPSTAISESAPAPISATPPANPAPALEREFPQLQILPSQPLFESSLPLTIDSPADKSIVRDNTILIRGKTSPAAFLTIGTSAVDLDENGNFSARISLVEGINIIEVQASDLAGNGKGRVLTTIYIP